MSNSPRSRLASDRQIAYIESLGGQTHDGMTVQEASEMIDTLLNGPTKRQMMILRFWDKLELADLSKDEVSEWMDEWYGEDPSRLAAWEAWKRKNGDNPELEEVPIGGGYACAGTPKAGCARKTGCFFMVLIAVILAVKIFT